MVVQALGHAICKTAVYAHANDSDEPAIEELLGKSVKDLAIDAIAIAPR
jgi:hypothetical protein